MVTDCSTTSNLRCRRLAAPTGRCPSGQREQTVNLPAYAFGGSNPPRPTPFQLSNPPCGALRLWGVPDGRCWNLPRPQPAAGPPPHRKPVQVDPHQSCLHDSTSAGGVAVSPTPAGTGAWGAVS